MKNSQNKLLEKAKNNPSGLRFSELQMLCKAVGMKCDRASGSHAIYIHENPAFTLSIQKMKDGKAKPYQVRQLLDMIDKHDLDKRKE